MSIFTDPITAIQNAWGDLNGEPSDSSALPGISWDNIANGTLSPDQQQEITNESAAAIMQAAAGNIALANSEIAQLKTEQGAVYKEFSTPTLSGQIISNLKWVGIGLIALYALSTVRSFTR